jgi:hypothetical protein
VINHFGPIKEDAITSINYDISYYNTGKQTPGYNTNIEYVDNMQSFGPIFPEERETPKPGQAAPQDQQSFLSKYVIFNYNPLVVGNITRYSIHDDE